MATEHPDNYAMLMKNLEQAQGLICRSYGLDADDAVFKTGELTDICGKIRELMVRTKEHMEASE